MKITHDLLEEKRACAVQLEMFDELFPDGAEPSEELCLEHAAAFDWDWAAGNLLDPDARAAYVRATADARAARAGHERAAAPEQARYARALADAWAGYWRAAEDARAGYERAVADARAGYERVAADARAGYARALAGAFAAAWKESEELEREILD
jgi:hypothetical protein